MARPVVFKPHASAARIDICHCLQTVGGKQGVCRNSQQKSDWRNAEQRRLLCVQTQG
jgi:hypothetical protein